MRTLMTYLCLLLATLSMVEADVIPYEKEYIHFSPPENWYKKPSKNLFVSNYFSWDDSNKNLLVQVHRQRAWAQWHMKGMVGRKDTFEKYYNSELGGPTGDVLEDLSYDEKAFQLRMVWRRPDNSLLLSQMQLTSFGCLAFHVTSNDEQIIADKLMLAKVANSLKIPERFKFVPEDLSVELLNNMGGAVIFIVMSLIYLMFSLFQRGQMRQRQMETAVYSERQELLSTFAENPSQTWKNP